MPNLFRHRNLLLIAPVLFAVSSPAYADEMEKSTINGSEVNTPALIDELAASNPTKSDEPLKLSGFVDTSYSVMANKKLTSSTNTFGLDQVELDIEKKWGNVGLRADIQSMPSAGNMFSIEQAYVTYSFSDTSLLMVGTFLAPIGWEMLDPTDMYQFSHSFLFNYGVPTFYTGALASFAAGPVDAVVYVSNGMDTYVDSNESKAAGTRIGVTPTDGVNFGLSYVYNTGDVMIADLDMTIEAGNTTIGGELNYGNDTPAGGKGDWMGALLVGAFRLSDDFGLTLRADWFNDNAGRVDPVKASYVNGTISPNYSIAENALILFEYTYGYKDAAGATDGSNLAALEMTYSF